MSKISSLVLDLQEAIASGEAFEVIARQFDVPVSWVLEAAQMIEDNDIIARGEEIALYNSQECEYDV